MDKVEGDSRSDGAVDSLPLSVLVANNVAMKLPPFWPDTGEAWSPQAHLCHQGFSTALG